MKGRESPIWHMTHHSGGPGLDAPFHSARDASASTIRRRALYVNNDSSSLLLKRFTGGRDKVGVHSRSSSPWRMVVAVKAEKVKRPAVRRGKAKAPKAPKQVRLLLGLILAFLTVDDCVQLVNITPDIRILHKL